MSQMQERLPAAPLQRGAKARKSRRQGVGAMWLFVLPAAAVYLFVVLWPTLQGMALSFTDWDGLSAVKNFVGFDNFALIFADPESFAATWRTILIAVVITVVQNVFGLLLALGVNSRIKSKYALRVALFAPVVIIPVATAYTWRFILAPTGPLNDVLSALGVQNPPDYLGDSQLAIWAVCLVMIWQYSGYSMVIFLAGLQGVPEEIIEASYLDGAGPVRRFWSIIRPELAPALTINLMLSIIGGLRIFDQVWALTNGGPGNSTMTISTQLYQAAFRFGEFGYRAALAVILTLMVAVISGIQYLALRRQNGN
ncbi:carbohydrate ABC transporter permease [Herbiconiux ginsengi]|uniref:Raffinose/stachyose/melibiose transport system permease protein n=1 Tax=Herbiconiux ginsengi TaxID=381665 RepID=A0A1H3LKU7_9MICO|nr:sugar ABC transporter permease [Herbiconiux ginsengi]SDY65003.1 raffinose/stachyose/melibiose transport system permease protein [Herbiconiux ginsengi]